MINNLDDLPTSASSSMSFDKKYDVFISFRGEDTRCNFTSHLNNALKKSGIDTYVDDRLDRGKEISKALMNAIDQSKFCVIVFSRNYATSSWCLDELVHICKCIEKKTLIALPVFYYVDPSDVRRQKGSYEAAFRKNEGSFSENKIKEWRDALTTVANHSGWSNSKTRNDAELVDKIVNFIQEKMDEASSAEQELVGMEEAILDLSKLLSNSNVTKLHTRTMAVELLVAPVVSLSIDVLMKNITSGVASILRGKIDSGFDGLLDNLETTLLSLAQVLVDAEQKQIKNTRVEEWLDKVEDAVEDAEHLFEEIEYDALNFKMEMESEPNKSKVSKFFSLFKSTFQKRMTEMEKILDRLVTFEKQRYKLDLRGDVEKIQSLRPPSISSIDHSEFFGRDAEKESLKRMLLSDVKVDSKNICVIPIVGLGGIGKTTLAQAVYNDNDVNEHFELKAWVCVSDEFDVIKVTKTIYEAVSRNGCTNGDLNVLQEKIQNILNKKKFLIVLDDIWNEEYNFWDTIRVLFKVGAQCSKIIVTTRSELVASIVGTTGSRHLDVLKKEACFKLFVKIVSGNEGFTTTDSNLGRIGKELVKKCKGLPLAVKAIASLLRFTNVKEWKRIAESDILKLSVGGKDILPTLRLSYHYLPSHLKRCFVYCSMFPKDYRFRKEELVPLWMVDNLLEYSSGNRAMKEVGFEYFDDLVSRSFFQPASEYESRDTFVMHDLMVDLANFVSKNKFVCVEEDKTYDIGMMRQIRHVSSNQVDSNVCKLISEATWLRTFLLVTKYYFHSNTFLPVLVRHLRFISLAGYTHLRELPESVGELRHLRHLNLSWTSIQELHGSICLLYNLQTLNLTGCKHLSKLPENFHRLINLRYLDMSFCKFCTLPPLGQLPALSTLSIESCGEVELVGVDFYGTSSSKSFPLLESLTFKYLSNWKEWSPPKANMETFPKLTSLTIHRCEKLIGDLPHLLPSLTKLDIYDCPELASSLSVMPAATSVYVRQCAKIAGFNLCSSLQNFDDLEDLYLMNCNNVDFLPPSSYVSLQKLYVHNISSSFKLLPLDSFPNTKNVTVWKCENLEAFSLLNILNSLSTLSILQCPKFTLLPESNLHCPILTRLLFYFCNKLKSLPENLPCLLPSLRQLSIYGCPELKSFPRCGLPFSLRELTIQNCNKLIASRKNWNLQALPNLTSFCIGDYNRKDMESFLEQGFLPTSLTSLKITHVAFLKTLDEKGFQELKSLKDLIIHECPLLEHKYEWQTDGCGRRKICCIPRPQVHRTHQSTALN